MPENKINFSDTISIEDNIDVLKKRKEHVSQRLLGFQFKGWILLILMFFGGLISYSLIFINQGEKQSSFSEISPRIILATIVTGFTYFYIILILRIKLQNQIRRIDYRLVQLGAEELQENIEENFFTKLVKINFKYLDQYYMQTQEQADKSFRLAAVASIVGLTIICAGIIMMFFDKNNPAYITTSSGVISELVAALFFYLYNRTILKMSQYHQKLVITQNISLALKITEDMDKDSKAKVQEKIVDRLTLDINKYLSLKD